MSKNKKNKIQRTAMLNARGSVVRCLVFLGGGRGVTRSGCFGAGLGAPTEASGEIEPQAMSESRLVEERTLDLD